MTEETPAADITVPPAAEEEKKEEEQPEDPNELVRFLVGLNPDYKDAADVTISCIYLLRDIASPCSLCHHIPVIYNVNKSLVENGVETIADFAALDYRSLNNYSDISRDVREKLARAVSALNYSVHHFPFIQLSLRKDLGLNA